MRITARLKCLHLSSASGGLDELLPTRKPQGWRDAAYNKAIVSRPLGHLQYGTAVAEGQTDQPRFTLDPDSPTYRLPSSLSFERRLKKASNSFDRRTHDGSKSPRWGGSEPPKSPKWGVADGALFSKMPQTAGCEAVSQACFVYPLTFSLLLLQNGNCGNSGNRVKMVYANPGISEGGRRSKAGNEIS